MTEPTPQVLPREASPEEEVRSLLRRIITVVINWWWVILIPPVLAGVLTFLFLSRQTPIYQATSLVLVQQASPSPLVTSGDLVTSAQLAGVYRDLVTTRPVLQRVVEQAQLPYGPDALAGKVRVSARPGSQILRISVRDSNPQEAARLANILADVFITKTQEDRLAHIARLQAAAQSQGVGDPSSLAQAQLLAMGTLMVIEPALPPRRPVAPATGRLTSLAVLLGALLGIVGAFAMEALNNKVRTPEEVEALLGVPVLGTVFLWKEKEYGSRPIWGRDRPKSTLAESYRQVQANTQFALAAHPNAKTLLITSPTANEGKSTTAVNLAVAFAQAGLRVLLVDADLRHTDLHRWFGISNERGLSNLLADANLAPASLVQETGIERLRLLPAGPTPPNPAELLSLPRAQQVFQALESLADMVLIDAPPVIPVSDALRLARFADGVLLVANPRVTVREALLQAYRAIRQTGTPVLGAILNGFSVPRFRYYGYGYRYGYYYYYHYGYYGYGTDGDGLSPRPKGVFARLQKALGMGRKHRSSRRTS
ncbi:MAG: polysaccharide biosynthesis tyrosine autokinase [Dehalococcoidia bacterium]|nr:polysaccharide biosynthesis tyrosine autokinase [Dehalococcoidia bacterium]